MQWVWFWSKRFDIYGLFSPFMWVLSDMLDIMEINLYLISAMGLMFGQRDLVFMVYLAVTYSGRLGDRYTGLGAQTLTPKRYFSSFHFSGVFQQKIRWSGDQLFFKMNLIISKWLRMEKCRQKRKTMRQRDRSERRIYLRKCFHSFKYVMDHPSICFFFYVNSL